MKLWALGWFLLSALGQSAPAQPEPRSKTDEGSQAAVQPLSFSQFFEPATATLRPSSKLRSLEGKRVRMTGYMAQMEMPPLGAFYLCPRPVFCDEAGGGTADLPVETVRVVVPSLVGREVRFLPGPLEVTGILELGSRAESDGHNSLIRVILESSSESTAATGTGEPHTDPRTNP